MGLFDFFKHKQKPKPYKMEMEKPSIEQTAFTDNVLEIISPTVEKFGFKLDKTEIKTYWTTIVWRKENQYVEVKGTNYPTDYPYYYNIVLGAGSSDNFLESDWNSVAIWALARIIEPSANINSYEFPFGDSIKFSLTAANKHLLKYGETFLGGDLTIFEQARKLINEKREPYKIHSPDSNGKYKTTVDPKSAEQKKKFS